MALRLLALVGLLTAAPRALAIDHDMAVWTALVGAVETDSALIASFETHVRRDGARSTALLRPAVGVRLADHWSTHAGYALILTVPDHGSVVNEHRAWGQVVGNASLGERVRVQSRTRLEHRFVGSGRVGHRARKFIRVEGPSGGSGGASPVVWNELFLGLNPTDWGAVAGVDQNRLFVGLFLLAPPWARLEAGYLFVYRDRGGADLYTHALAINLFVSARPPAPPVEDPEAPR